MKKKRTVSIKNPRLSKIRNGFRTILLEIAKEQWFDYHANVVRKGGSRMFDRLKQELDKTVSNSICECHRCVAADKDMTYNPVDGAWYCVDCYDEMKQWTAKKKTGVSILFP